MHERDKEFKRVPERDREMGSSGQCLRETKRDGQFKRVRERDREMGRSRKCGRDRGVFVMSLVCVLLSCLINI